MKRIFLTLTFLGIISLGFTQKTEFHALNGGHPKVNNFTAYLPNVKAIKGLMVLLPGFGEDAENVEKQSELPKLLAQNGYLTMIPILQEGTLSFGIDDKSQYQLQLLITEAQQRYQLTDLPYFIGGFSIGGSAAIKYAQEANTKPKAVFAIDPPLDFERFYTMCERDIYLNKDNASAENRYVIERLEEIFNGTPKNELENYHRISPYSYSDWEQKNVKKLISVPIRIYTEPDVIWWMNERNSDFLSMNATDCSAFINELFQLGNVHSELIVTQNKGFRYPEKNRHPHSWSIVDGKALLSWLSSF